MSRYRRQLSKRRRTHTARVLAGARAEVQAGIQAFDANPWRYPFRAQREPALSNVAGRVRRVLMLGLAAIATFGCALAEPDVDPDTAAACATLFPTWAECEAELALE